MKKRSLLILAGVLSSAAAALAQPIITAVQDAGGYTANVAQGSVFVVKGTTLSAAGYNPAPSLPLPTTLANVRITFTSAAGGLPIDVFMVYTYNVSGVNQLAAVLPSTLAPGDYDVRVVNEGATSSPFRTRVIARKFGIITQDSSGSGNAVVQNFISSSRYDVNRLTSGTFAGTSITYAPSHPGQVVVIWGVGGGGVLSGADNVAPGLQDFRARSAFRVLVGGVSITPDLYAGRAPEFPGVDEVILTLPANVPTGCAVSLQVSVDGELSNPATIAIAPAGADACVSSIYSRDTLIRLDQGGAITTGNFVLSSFSTSMAVPGFGTISAKVEGANGSFSRYTGAQFASASSFANDPGTCQVFRRIGDQTSLIFGGSVTNLNAGENIVLSGPNVLPTNNQLKRETASNTYNLSLGTAISGISLPPGLTLPGFNATPIIAQGTYTLTGAGGPQVGPFEARVTLGAPIVVGELPASIPRSQALTVRWTGGAASDQIQVVGISGGAVGGAATAPVYDAGVFICTGNNTGSLTVPASVLAQLPPTPAATGGIGAGIGALTVISSSVPSATSGRFTASLASGGSIDQGFFLGTVGSLVTTVYQ